MNADAVQAGTSLASVLELERSVDGTLLGASVPGRNNHIFGGQLLAQSVVAAGTTVSAERAAHSTHAYFLRAGDSSLPVDYRVENMRDGRSFSVRRVTASQGERTLLTQIVSFSVAGAGPSHVVSGVSVQAFPGPDAFAHFARPDEETLPHRSLLEMRRLPPELDPRGGGGQAMWLRIPRPIPRDPSVRRGVIALATDYALLEPVAIAQGVEFGSSQMRVASLDHSLWWLADPDIDDWLLVVQDSPWSDHGRGIARASVFSRGGALIALVQQEGMLHVVDAPKR